ncbi:hypothetical protein X798_01407 [Onchocerca flexuosa]|uniref:Uncharacterized protein n=1 Tax=Onchocerca flexuosa TaxID=387005 RepID=A0A238C258_9BILA|nr:hypothetical protein X798_01407 [Onchocerca flexuosa]
MDIHNCPLFDQNFSNTENEHEKISFGESSKGKEPSLSSEFSNTLKIFVRDDRENIISGTPKVDVHLTKHQPRSRTRNCKPSDPFRVHNCRDRLPSLETEQQFRIAVTKCPRGGDSLERNPSNGKKIPDTYYDVEVVRNVPNLPPLVFKTKPVIISSSPEMKTYSSAKVRNVEGRKTPAEIDAFFTRLSTPKYIRGKVSKEKKVGNCVQQLSAAHHCRCDATKGLHVNVVRTRSNSIVRSGSRPSNVGK